MKVFRDYEYVKQYVFNSAETELLKAHTGKVITGTPGQIKHQINKIAGYFNADEVMAVSWAAKYEDRLRSFELLSSAFNLQS